MSSEQQINDVEVSQTVEVNDPIKLDKEKCIDTLLQLIRKGKRHLKLDEISIMNRARRFIKNEKPRYNINTENLINDDDSDKLTEKIALDRLSMGAAICHSRDAFDEEESELLLIIIRYLEKEVFKTEKLEDISEENDDDDDDALSVDNVEIC